MTSHDITSHHITSHHITSQVRAEGVQLSADAAAVERILDDWRRTADDKDFAMKTRFFPLGVKIPGVKWTD